jgi:8-oxo-dGTP pyrophosphatase MutT (NUDIX family)
MALPGGKCSPEDQSMLQTVVRETREETGINLLGSCCHLIGTLGVFTSTRRPDLKVLPFVGVLEKIPLITLNNELESYIWINANDLAQSRGEAEIEGRKVSAFVVRQHVIWGLTFRILDSFAHRVLKLTW